METESLLIIRSASKKGSGSCASSAEYRQGLLKLLLNFACSRLFSAHCCDAVLIEQVARSASRLGNHRRPSEVKDNKPKLSVRRTRPTSAARTIGQASGLTSPQGHPHA